MVPSPLSKIMRYVSKMSTYPGEHRCYKEDNKYIFISTDINKMRDYPTIGPVPLVCELSCIHCIKLCTSVYTPGYPGWAHPNPQLLTPEI